MLYSKNLLYCFRLLANLQHVVLCLHMTVEELFACKVLAANVAGHGLTVAQVHEAHVTTRVGRVGVDLAAHHAGHPVSMKVACKTTKKRISYKER